VLPPKSSPLVARIFAVLVPVQASGGYGLCIFFVLSAYLITRLLLCEKSTAGSVNIKAFYVRRILRIWPLYFTFLLICAVFFLGYGKGQIEPLRFLALSLLVGNWYSGHFGFGENPVGPLWSISLEEQFYLLWPVIAKYLRVRSMTLVVASIVPLSLATIFVLRSNGAGTDCAIWTNSLVQFLFFATGALLAIGLHARITQNSAGVAVGLLAVGLGIWLGVSLYLPVKSATVEPPPFQVMFAYLLLAIACAAILIGALSMPQRWCVRPLVFLGKISYGLYVFHLLSIQVWARICGRTLPEFLMARPLALATTIVLAMISYRFLERPFLNLKKSYERIHSRPV
jgi:peptidoglycan/LPS O-acetylase OafA/YrhL